MERIDTDTRTCVDESTDTHTGVFKASPSSLAGDDAQLKELDEVATFSYDVFGSGGRSTSVAEEQRSGCIEQAEWRSYVRNIEALVGGHGRA